MKIIGKTILTLLVLSISVLCGMEIQKRANLVSQILPDTIILGNEKAARHSTRKVWNQVFPKEEKKRYYLYSDTSYIEVIEYYTDVEIALREMMPYIKGCVEDPYRFSFDADELTSEEKVACKNRADSLEFMLYKVLSDKIIEARRAGCTVDNYVLNCSNLDSVNILSSPNGVSKQPLEGCYRSLYYVASEATTYSEVENLFLCIVDYCIRSEAKRKERAKRSEMINNRDSKKSKTSNKKAGNVSTMLLSKDVRRNAVCTDVVFPSEDKYGREIQLSVTQQALNSAMNIVKFIIYNIYLEDVNFEDDDDRDRYRDRQMKSMIYNIRNVYYEMLGRAKDNSVGIDEYLFDKLGILNKFYSSLKGVTNSSAEEIDFITTTFSEFILDENKDSRSYIGIFLYAVFVGVYDLLGTEFLNNLCKYN